MKKLSYLALLIALPISATHAGVTITPFYGYHHAEWAWDDQTNELKDSANVGYAKENDAAYGVAVGAELTPSIALEAEYLNANTNVKPNRKTKAKHNFKQENVSVNLILNSDFITQRYDNPLKPYVVLGGGMGHYKVESKITDNSVAASDDFLVNFGIGAKYRLNDFVAVKSEVRGIYNTGNAWFEGLALAGVEFTLGGHLKPDIPEPPSFDFEDEETAEPQEIGETQPEEVSQPKDTDLDGVIDAKDKCPNTKAGATVDDQGCYHQEAMKLRVYFGKNQSTIKPRFKPEIKNFANIMQENKKTSAVIEGHTSKTGSYAYNMKLSKQRAESVKHVLTHEYDINPARIFTKGYGWQQPIAPNTNATGRALNQRVYAIITEK